MIHKGCQWLVEDEDCNVCLKKGYFSGCEGCEEEQIKEREENKKIWKQEK